MKTAIFSDLHSTSPIKEIECLDKLEGVERFVFLGDYDTPEIFRELIGLKKKKIILIGNHDFDLVSNRDFDSPAIDFDYSKILWDNSPNEKTGAIRMANMKNSRTKGIKVVEQIEKRRVVYLHGALEDFGCIMKRQSPLVWGRMLNDSSRMMNFSAMKSEKYWLMFRGHDHEYNVWSIDYNAPGVGNVQENRERVIPITKDKRYIVSVGAFEKGEYLIFDSKKLELERRVRPVI